MKIKDAAILTGVGGLAAGKVYAGHKYLQYRQRKARERAGLGMPLNRFARLPRRKQAGMIQYRRHRLRELEGVYYRGGTRRRRAHY